VVFAEIETGTETESCDNDSEIPDSPTGEEDSYCEKPRTWSEAYGKMQKHAYQLVLSEKCKSYTAAKELSKPVGGDSPGPSELKNLSGRPSGRRSPQVHIKVGKGHQMCTGCSKFIGSAAQVRSSPFMKFSLSLPTACVYLIACQTPQLRHPILVINIPLVHQFL
jgi:hypothetical protein